MAKLKIRIVILNWIPPRKFLVATVSLSVISVPGLFTGIGWIVALSVILIGLGFANILSLVFSITIDSLPEKTNQLSGLMLNAIAEGALLPPILGFVVDRTATEFGFVVPFIALLYIGWASLRNVRLVNAEMHDP